MIKRGETSQHPIIPEEIIERIKLKEPELKKKIIKIIYSEPTNQFSIKIPSIMSIELKLKSGDKFEISTNENKEIILRRV